MKKVLGIIAICGGIVCALSSAALVCVCFGDVLRYIKALRDARRNK